jgi:hypothetical protein
VTRRPRSRLPVAAEQVAAVAPVKRRRPVQRMAAAADRRRRAPLQEAVEAALGQRQVAVVAKVAAD